jgi:hypothetical protein
MDKAASRPAAKRESSVDGTDEARREALKQFGRYAAAAPVATALLIRSARADPFNFSYSISTGDD